MKTLLLMLLLVTFTVSSQDQFTTSLNWMAVNEKDTFVIGWDIKYQGGLGYVRAGVNIATDFEKNILGESTQKVMAPEINAGFGINLRSGMWDEWRYYAGAYASLFIAGDPYSSAGPEVGIEHYFRDTNFYVGAKTMYVYTDLPLHYHEKERMALLVNFQVGFHW